MVILNFCFKKFGLGLHADSVVLVDLDLFLRQILSNRHLVSFAAITASLTHPGMYFPIRMFGMKWCMFVNKGGSRWCDINCREYQHL